MYTPPSRTDLPNPVKAPIARARGTSYFRAREPIELPAFAFWLLAAFDLGVVLFILWQCWQIWGPRW